MDAISYAKASSAYKLAKQVETGLTNKVSLGGSSIIVPVGTTATRPTLGAGESAIRYNSDVGGLEEWTGVEWKNVSADINAVALKGTDTEVNILAKVGMVAEDLWIASDTLDGWVYDGLVWINIGPLQGPQGVQGIQGIQGIQGEVGPQGIQGIQGEIGPQGIQGIQGIQGETGLQGIQGETGIQGIAGKSAYTVAAEGGFVGTEAQWLLSLVGDTGATGNGIASIVKTGTLGLVDTYTVTMTSGATATFTVTNGLDGVDGLDVDHIAQTSGTGAAGTVDVYTVWGDVAETISLGTFNVYNGTDGLDGAPGLSAYEIAISNGFIGTEGEWLESLNGTDGTGLVNSVVAGANVTVDSTDPTSPVVGLGASVTTQGNTFNGAEQLVKLGVDGKLPVLDGSNLTGIDGLPDQTGFAGKYLKTDGTVATWEEVSSGSGIITPSIITPSNASTEIVLGPTVTTSIYETADNYSGVHTGSILEVATDASFTTIAQTVTTGLTSLTVVGLADNTTYYLRVRYVSGEFLSDWSEVTSFTTLDILINQPTITVIGSPSSISKVAVINGSAFATTNGTDTHASTNWRVVRTSDSVVVYTIAETTNKTSITVPEGILEIGVKYSFEAQYVGTQYGSSVYGIAVGTIANIYVSTPTLTVDGTPSDVAETPTLITSAFSVFNGTDAHSNTDWQVYEGVTLVWESLADSINKLSIVVPSGILEVSKIYTFKAKHNGTTYGSSAYAETTGTTKASFSIQYGLQWNNTADTYTRLGAAASWTTGADFTNNETVQSLMRRCVLNANGTVNYYLSATDSTKREDGVTAADLTGASGNVMVEIPKFWVKYDNTTSAKQMWISTVPSAGYVVHPAWVKNGVEVDYRYYRAYKGSYNGTKLISRSGAAATGSQTIVTFRTYAKANGTGWGLVDWHLLFAVQTLLFIEIGTFNSQAVLGNGNDTGSDYGMTTGGSNSIGNASSPATNDDTWMSYRGIENFYADIYEWIDGINISGRLVYTSNTQSTFASDVFSGAYTSTGVTLPSSGYISDMNFSIKGFIPTVAAGSDSTYVTDYVYSNAGARVAAFGGYASYGLICGAAFLDASAASSNASAGVGAGLSF